MPGMPWVKIYTEILDDVKIARLTDSQKWRFVQLILFAAECDAEGALVTGDSPVSHEDVTVRLRCDMGIWMEDYKKLLALGLIFLDDEVIVVTNFANKQGPSQEEKRRQWRERQRKRRDRVKKSSPVTHGGVTPLEEEEEEEIKIETPDSGRFYSLYEQEIGALTPMISEQISDWVDNHPLEWIEEAIKIAVENNKRKASYINGILSNWRTEGRNNSGKPAPSIDEELEKRGYEQR